jgi:hypothetical protein
MNDIARLKYLSTIINAQIEGKEVEVMDNGKWRPLKVNEGLNSSWQMRLKPVYRWFTVQEAFKFITDPKRGAVYTGSVWLRDLTLVVESEHEFWFEGATHPVNERESVLTKIISAANHTDFVTHRNGHHVPFGILDQGTGPA